MSFAPLLRKLLDEKGLSCAAFARSVGIKPPLVFAVRSGKQRIPKRRIERWADAFGLRGAARDEFLEAAWLSHASPYVQALVAKLKKRSG